MGGLSTSLEDRSVLPFEVRGPEPGFVTLTSGVSVTYPNIEVEGLGPRGSPAPPTRVRRASPFGSGIVAEACAVPPLVVSAHNF